MRRRLKAVLRATYRGVKSTGGSPETPPALDRETQAEADQPLPASETQVRAEADPPESPAPYGGPLRIRPAAWAQAEAESPETPPHYGATLDLLVRAAALNPRPPEIGEEYDRIKPHFDAAFYFVQHSDIAAKRIDPVAHYIQAGAREGRDPTSLFSTRAYLQRYPDVADHHGTPFDHWLAHGRAEGRDAGPASIGEEAPSAASAAPAPPPVETAEAESPASYGGPLRIRSAAWAEAEVETLDIPPHYGATLDLLVRAAAINPRPPEINEEYDRIKPHFDAAFYFAQHSDIAAKRIDPVAHYIQAGAREGRDPTSLFSTRAYLQRYPEVADHHGTPFDHWLTHGRADGRDAGPASIKGMNDVLGLTDAKILDHLAARNADLRDRLVTGELGRMVSLAARHDSTVLRVWPAALRLRVLPFSTTRITDRIASLYRMQAALGWRRARAVIVTGGDEGPEPVLNRTLGMAVAAFGAGEVVVLQTASLPPSPLPDPSPGLRVLHVSDQAQRHRTDNARLLADLLRSLRPAAVIADHDPLFSLAMRNYGRALRACFNIAMTAPRDLATPLGHPTPSREMMLYRILPVADFLICEDAAMRDRLAEAHHLDAADRDRLVPIADLEAPGIFAAVVTAARHGDPA